MAILVDLCKCGSVTFNRLTDPTISAIKLHGALYLERSRICRVARDSNEHEPFLVCSDSIVDDLGTRKCGMTVEDFLRRRRLV